MQRASDIFSAAPARMNLDEYLRLLDWTGRQVQQGKCGAIPAELPPILKRPVLQAESWLSVVTQWGRWFHRAVGSADRLTAWAKPFGRRWLHGITANRLAFS